MIGRLVLFGASGDLAGRYLLPALAELHAAGRLPEGFEVTGSATDDWSDDEFRRHAAEALSEFAASVPTAGRDALVASLRYQRVDFDDGGGVRRAISGDGPLVAYLALPSGVFAAAAAALQGAGLPPGSRVAIEKPFGEDLDSARALNARLAELFGDAVDRVVFRVDHVLGMATAHNLLAMRTRNRLLEQAWSGEHVECVEILWEETLALEGRAGYYDRAGALRDVLQNHMLEVLCLLALEPPPSAGADALRERRVEVLRALRPGAGGEMASWTRRARYTAGRIGDRDVPSYVDEEGVDPSAGTETFAELTLELESERWAGTTFRLRAGKALGTQRKGAVVHFRSANGGAPRSELWIGIDGPHDVTLTLAGLAAGQPDRGVPMTLAGEPPPSELGPYARVLLDVLSGDAELSVGGEEAEAAWELVTPVLRAWKDGEVPLEEYPAGSSGPE